MCGACYEQQRPSQQRAGEWTSSYIDAAPVPSIKIFDATTKKLLAVPIPDSAHRTALADRTPAPVETVRRQLTELIKAVEWSHAQMYRRCGIATATGTNLLNGKTDQARRPQQRHRELAGAARGCCEVALVKSA